MDFGKHRSSADEVETICKNVNQPNWEKCYPAIKDCKKVLDVGCGSGWMMQYMKDRGHEVYGITYSEDEIKYCEAKGLTAINCDIHEIIYDKEQFDAVTCWDCLEHAIAPLIVLKEIRRVLKPGGIAMIYMPGQNWIECQSHITVLNQRQMKHLLYLAKFELVQAFCAESRQRVEGKFDIHTELEAEDACREIYFKGFGKRVHDFYDKEVGGSITYIVRKENEDTDPDPI